MKKTRLKKRILALLLSAGITFTSLPLDSLYVQAADSSDSAETVVDTEETKAVNESIDEINAGEPQSEILPEEAVIEEEPQNKEPAESKEQEPETDDSRAALNMRPMKVKRISEPYEMVFTGKLLGDIDDEMLAQMEAGTYVVPQTYGNEPIEGTDLSNAVTLTRIIVKIDGEEYDGGDITIKEGTPFAYEFEWKLSEKAQEGDKFKKTIFKIPGLNIPEQKNIPAIIYANNRSIRIGTMNLTYDKNEGNLDFSMEFSKYVSVFKDIEGYKSGTGTFGMLGSGDKSIIVGDDQGELTVEKKEDKPQQPTNPEGDGVGWAAPKPPTFNNTTYAFGKGIKWSSPQNYIDNNGVARIEWRAVFFDELQKRQSLLLEDNKELLGSDRKGSIADSDLEKINKVSLDQTSGCYIIEDTLDVNQQFIRDPEIGNEANYKKEAPFFLEIPIIVPGTGTILNGSVGNGSYDTQGIIEHKVLGDVFQKAETEEEVRKEPLTWMVVKVKESNSPTKEKLIVNLGKLGTEPTENPEDEKGLALPKNIKNAVLEKINSKIGEAKTAIEKMKEASDSPVVELKQKNDALKTYITNQKWNTEESDSAFAQFEKWYTDYFSTTEAKISSLTPEQLNSLNEIKLSDKINQVAESYEELKKQNVYLNWMQHFNNIEANQALYANNRNKYLENWEYALGRYQLTKAFYEDGKVYGFCLKYMVDVINPTAPTYSNHIKISMQEKTYEADDSADIKFNVGVSGNFPLGSSVFKKADNVYQNYNNAVNNGLAGAKFQMYCASESEEDGWEFVKDDEHLGVFADKDASETGNAYVWSHHVGDEASENSGIVSTEDGLITLETDAKGTLALTGMDTAHPHYLVETEAPQGYYLDSTPIEFQVNCENILFKYVPNIARGVKITKASSYDGNPVQGAEFMLYQAADNQPLTGGFTQKTTTVNGVSTINYWYDTTASNQTLITFENGDLNILGLPAGSYYLKETNPAPGYVLSEEQRSRKYSFTLPEKITEEFKNSLCEENGFYYTYVTGDHSQVITTIFNDEATKELSLTKVGKDNQPLSGAAFNVLRWTGTEEEWRQGPEHQELWTAVSWNGKNSPYFNTGNPAYDAVVEVDKNGELVLKNMPNGHYALVEVIAPEGYQTLDNWLYFDVDVSTEDKVQLYWNVNQENAINNNRVPNELYPGALRLYKLVSGNGADLTTRFKFKVSLKKAGTTPVSGEFNATWFKQSEGSDAENSTMTGTVTFDEKGECTINLAHEEGVIITGLPAGMHYNIEEETNPLYNLTLANGHGMIPSQGTAIATAKNRYKTGILRITKNVTGSNADRNKEFEFDVTMKNTAGAGIDGTFKYEGAANTGVEPPKSGSIKVKAGRAEETIKLKAGQRITVSGIPAGTECTVQEKNSEGYMTRISVQDVHINEDGEEEPSKITNTEGTTGTIHITDNNRADMNFNNISTPDPGNLIISKAIDSVCVDEAKEFAFHLNLKDKFGNAVSGKFDVEVNRNPSLLTKIQEFFKMNIKQSETDEIEFDDEGNAAFTLKHRDYLLIKNLPEDITYTLTEESAEGYISSLDEENEGTGTITAGESAAVAVVNYREEGNLVVSKEVSGKGGDFNKEFTFNISAKNADGTPLTGTYTYVGSAIENTGNVEVPENGSITFKENETAVIKLKHGQRILISGLPKDVRYTVTEEADEKYEASYTNDSGTTTGTTTSGTIQDNVESHACFTNRYKTGELRVLKNVVIGDMDQNFTFTVTLSDKNINGEYHEMTFKDGVAVFTLKHGESKVAADLPAGTEYTVEESNNEGYSVTVNNASGVIDDKEIVMVQFNNAKKINLIVNKTVTGDLADKTKPFTFTIDLQNSEGVPLEGEYQYVGSVLSETGNGIVKPEDGVLHFRNGQAIIQLSHGQQIEIKNLPKDCHYTVTEEKYSGYQTTYNGEQADKAIGILDKTVTVNVVNISNTVPDMGISDSHNGIGIILGVGSAAILLLIILTWLKKRIRV